MIGFDDVIMKRLHTTTVKCANAEGKVLAMKAEEFMFKMQKDQKTWQFILDMANQ
jgi:hypothetical protein